jgi:ankyrin repeat protein
MGRIKEGSDPMKRPTRSEWQAMNKQVTSLRAQGQYDRAAGLASTSLRIAEKTFGPDHPDVAVALDSLAALHADRKHYVLAASLYGHSLAIREKAHGADHRDVAMSLRNLTELYRVQGRQALSKPLLKRLRSWWLQKSEELYVAAGRADVPAVASLLADGADPAYQGEEETPLHETVIYGHPGRLEVAELLIEHQARLTGGNIDPWYIDADSEFGTPLGIAVDNDDVEMVDFLLGYGADPGADGCGGGTPLHRAAKSGNEQVLCMLLEYMGLDANVDVVSANLDVEDTTPLHVAAELGDLAIVRRLSLYGANLNAADADGETPLCKAARGGHGRVVRWLLAKGTAIDGGKDKSPLAAAAAAGARNAVAMLLRAGAKRGATYDGSTALKHARSCDHRAIVSLLQR